MKDRCEKCGKVVFWSKSRAKHALKKIAEANDRTEEYPNRAYECPVGQGYHLTKKAKITKPVSYYTAQARLYGKA